MVEVFVGLELVYGKELQFGVEFGNAVSGEEVEEVQAQEFVLVKEE